MIDFFNLGCQIIAFMNQRLQGLSTWPTFLLDYLMYSSWVLEPLNFLSSGGGHYFGTHKWHWYFTQGLIAVLLFTFLSFSLTGIFLPKQ
ncbi:hypothetical protein LguiA_017311 [Lonicera macranthoides]